MACGWSARACTRLTWRPPAPLGWWTTTATKWWSRPCADRHSTKPWQPATSPIWRLAMTDVVKLDGFKWEIELVDLATGEVIEREVQHNRIPKEGLDFLIQAPFGAVAPVGSFYCGLFRANYLPVAETKAADIPNTLQEFVDYAEPTRPLWERAYNGAGTQDNFANKAVFTPTADA